MPCGNEPTQINQWQHHGLTAKEVSAVPRNAGGHLGIVSDMDPMMISKLAGYTTGEKFRGSQAQPIVRAVR